MPIDSTVLPPHISLEFRPPTELLNRQDIIIPHLYAWHAKENPNFPLFVFHDGHKLQFITYSVADRAIDRAARYALSSMQSHNEHQSNKVIGVLVNADTMTYACTILGLLRAGFAAFLISTRNNAAAIVDMAQKTGFRHLISSSDAVIRDLASEVVAGLANAGVEIVQHVIPAFADLFTDAQDDPTSPFSADVDFPTSYDPNAPALIIHSSGSMGHPKPIAWSHAHMIKDGKQVVLGGADWRGAVLSSHGTPMFHGLGSFIYSGPPILGFVAASFPPASPPIVPSPDAVWEGMIVTNTDFTWVVPSFVEEWVQDTEKIQRMKKMRGVFSGGAGLNDHVVKALAAHRIPSAPLYGCTETGLISDFGEPHVGDDHDYWSPAPLTRCVFRPREEEPGTYEVIVLSFPEAPLQKINTKEGDVDAYATSDIAIPHPTDPGRWKIIGRADEQIILSNGEKTNPVPLERIINEDPHVKCAVMFGRGKFQNGVLIEPALDYVIDPSDSKQLEAFRNVIWPTIERVNEFAPQHSRLFKEMILVTSPSKPFLFNVKNLARRGIILQDYHDEIEQLYRDVQSSAQGDIGSPATWDTEKTLAFVRTVVEHTLRKAIPDDADIFRSGGDSLQATWIRNTILRALRETDEDAAKRIPSNLVFAAPTISALANTLLRLVGGAGGSGAHGPEDLWKYVERYSADLPARPQRLVPRPAGGKDVVVITGTTGGFGCDALEHLLRDEGVGRVYAFNRKGTQAMVRQRAQFATRSLDGALLDSPKFTMVEAALHERDFGLDPELLDEIRCSVTHIMHNAWKVNFSFALPTFEVDIQGARNLVDLALSSPFITPPTVVFVSSIGVFSNCKIPPPVPEHPIDDPEMVFGTGYSESKWITERVLQNVSKRTDVHTVVVRLGQVAGDRQGYWNEKEWFPSMVKSALFQRCLPDFEGSVSWFSAYEAAQAFTEMRRSPHPILHLVHPRPVSWHALMTPVAEALGVPLVPHEHWLAALQKSAREVEGTASEVDATKANPALGLLPFFKHSCEMSTGEEREPMGLVYLSTAKAGEVSEVFVNMPQLDEERAKKWVAAWKRSGFL